ncbi:uncharacterized protein PADG_06364 [Paracoccidioides brasiliensis Pb18]|uniref:Uncharacterized protein n=1 Tax=Paracoccidioides brasiliensis (strain Pb18) TaxID=502780 RepID=C1GGC7_PARBD|nr:uncharacterized protein PADG_06364 [Paracoccidioides brasiliensis Pb18]EEH50285.2 hypothetical protein PADG_06364 [Paracoccidioides brasiliensis Pb18]
MSSAPAGDADRSTDGIHAGFPTHAHAGRTHLSPHPSARARRRDPDPPAGVSPRGEIVGWGRPPFHHLLPPPHNIKGHSISARSTGRSAVAQAAVGPSFDQTHTNRFPRHRFSAGRHGVSSRDVSVPHACNVSRVAAVGSAGIGGHPGSFLRSHGWSRGDGHPGPSRPPTAPPRRDPRPFSMPGRAPPVWSRAPSAPPVAPSTAGQLERSRRICPHPPPPAGRGIPGGKAGPESAARQRVRGGDPPSEGPMRQPVFALAGRHTILPRTVL